MCSTIRGAHAARSSPADAVPNRPEEDSSVADALGEGKGEVRQRLRSKTARPVNLVNIGISSR